VNVRNKRVQENNNIEIVCTSWAVRKATNRLSLLHISSVFTMRRIIQCITYTLYKQRPICLLYYLNIVIVNKRVRFQRRIQSMSIKNAHRTMYTIVVVFNFIRVITTSTQNYYHTHFGRRDGRQTGRRADGLTERRSGQLNSHNTIYTRQFPTKYLHHST